MIAARTPVDSLFDTEEAPPTVRLSSLTALPFLQHGFSTRTCGNLASRYGPPAEVAAARRTFARLVGADPARMAHFALTHSSRVGLVSEADAMPIDETPYRISIRGLLADARAQDLTYTNAQGSSNQQGIDGLVTTTPGLGLFMIVGDSAPVMLVAPEGRGIALAHVGIVGTVNGLLEHTVAALCQTTGCRPSELVAGIGPTVGPCCYALSQSVTWGQVVATVFFERYGPHGAGIIIRNDQYFFDLPGAVSAMLEAQGVPRSSIETCGLCTACPNSSFFSHHAGVAGRFGAILALRER